MQLSRNKTLEAPMKKCQGTPGKLDTMLPTTAKVQAKGHKETGFPWRVSRICTPAHWTKPPKHWPREGAPALFSLALFSRACRAPRPRVWVSSPLGAPCLSSGSDPGAQQCVHFKTTITTAISGETRTLESTSKYSRTKHSERKPSSPHDADE